ncbi:MAG: SAM-dependent methyltransferase [Rickettsiaceae bacterium]|jgi:SAM-dependent methyltransferase|nr:SAM-dependent methyltransferase [Rickettsiaceae bacterium]
MKHYFKSSIILFILALGLSVAYLALKPNKWEVYFKNKLNEPARDFVVKAINSLPIPVHGEIIALDLGASVGNETAFLLEKGFKVIAVDNQKLAFDFMLKRPDIVKFQNRLTTIISPFQELDFSTIPMIDIVTASYSLPFCPPEYFEEFWVKLVRQIKPGGYFVGNFFDPGFTAFTNSDRKQMTLHTKSQIVSLFKDFKIIDFKEVKKEAKEVGKLDHYHIVIAEKL